jgi:hypothetical protein
MAVDGCIHFGVNFVPITRCSLILMPVFFFILVFRVVCLLAQLGLCYGVLLHCSGLDKVLMSSTCSLVNVFGFCPFPPLGPFVSFLSATYGLRRSFGFLCSSFLLQSRYSMGRRKWAFFFFLVFSCLGDICRFHSMATCGLATELLLL